MTFRCFPWEEFQEQYQYLVKNVHHSFMLWSIPHVFLFLLFLEVEEEEEETDDKKMTVDTDNELRIRVAWKIDLNSLQRILSIEYFMSCTQIAKLVWFLRERERYSLKRGVRTIDEERRRSYSRYFRVCIVMCVIRLWCREKVLGADFFLQDCVWCNFFLYIWLEISKRLPLLSEIVIESRRVSNFTSSWILSQTETEIHC